VFSCRASLPPSRQTLNFAAGIIRRHRIWIGSLWRKLNPGQQALLVLVYLRNGETFTSLAAGSGVGTATAWRYAEETVALLAARAPGLRKAARDAARAGHACAVLDGTLIPIDRVAADRPFYPGKHKRHGMNLQVIAGPRRRHPLVSGALPGSVHDNKAEWMRGVLAELEDAGLVTLADKGYQGSTYAKIPYKGKNKPDSQKQANKAHAKLAVLERAGLIQKRANGREQLVSTNRARLQRADELLDLLIHLAPARGAARRCSSTERKMTMPITSVTKDPEKLTLTVVADFPVPQKRPWDAWADPRQLERFWGPPLRARRLHIS
jgi:hypothetical protein